MHSPKPGPLPPAASRTPPCCCANASPTSCSAPSATWALDVVALACAFAAFVFAYVIGQLGGLIPLPGGIGGIDGGLTGALTLYGSPLSQATAAVLAYRVVQLGIPAILGSVAFVQLRHTLSREEAPAALCEPQAAPLPVFMLPPRG